jgi:DNA-binding NarL/FixJ family response regulator
MKKNAPMTSAATSPGPAGLATAAVSKPGGLTDVAIVEDNPKLRQSLARLIDLAPGMRCVGAWADGKTALTQLPALQPQVVLMDINMPGMTGIECTERLKRALPETQVIMVTVYENADNIFSALQAGASGYLLKRSSAAEIIDAINEVRSGGAPMTSEIARKVVQAFKRPPAKSGVDVELTQRENEILSLLSQGFANKQIADKLKIAANTVKVHTKHIYEKLHVRSRTEAMAKYMGGKTFSAGSSFEITSA